MRLSPKTTRTLSASTFFADYSDWPGLALVFQVRKQVTCDQTGCRHAETTYGIKNLADARRYYSARIAEVLVQSAIGFAKM